MRRTTQTVGGGGGGGKFIQSRRSERGGTRARPRYPGVEDEFRRATTHSFIRRDPFSITRGPLIDQKRLFSQAFKATGNLTPRNRTDGVMDGDDDHDTDGHFETQK